MIAHRPRAATPSELVYLSVGCAEPQPLPDAFAAGARPACELSVIVPAFNEAARLRAMLDEAVAYLSRTYTAGDWEIVIVDDGSRDGTAATALRFARESPAVRADELRVVVLAQNRGKGGAVAHGMRHARGRYAVFADADGASRFADLATLMKRLRAVERRGYGIAVGSRAHLAAASSAPGSGAIVRRSPVRAVLMYCFHTLLRAVGVRDVADTQCGFKLFSRAAARAVFADLRTERWIFDIEVLLLARYKRIPVVEVPVSWHEVAGTKISLVADSLRMAWDLVVVRAGYALGIYTVGPGGPGPETETKSKTEEVGMEAEKGAAEGSP